MLQDIRQNIQGTIAKIIIGLIVVSFSIFGIESILFSPGSNAVAEVNGTEITPFDLQQEITVLQRQLVSMLGDNLDPAMLDNALMSEQALQSLVARAVVTQAAADLNLAVSDQALGQVIASMETFQVNGQFSVDLYQSQLATSGYTPTSFRQRLSEDMLQSQLRAGLGGSVFVTDSELAAAARVSAEGRDLRYVTLPLDRYRDEVTIEEADARAYYDANVARFESPESLDLEYMALELDDYREPVDEERLREEFDIVRSEFMQAEETRVSHILFESEGSERLAAAQAAIAGGMSFEDAAAEYSDDIGSASLGGDLGFTAGDTFPEEMEEAIAALAVGESGSVETDAGTHLLLVTDRRDGTEVAFEDVRFELEERLQTADASAALLIDVERLRDIAFNAADLSEPASELKRSIERVEGVTITQGEGLFADAALRRAAFSEDVLEAGHNSDVVELSPERFVVLRVANRNAPAPQPLEAVRETIDAELREEAAQQAAREAAQDMLAGLESGETVESLANAADLDWQVELGARRDSTRLPADLRDRVFALAVPAEGVASRDIVSGSDAIYLFELFRVTPGSIDSLSAMEQLALRQRLSADASSVLLQQYEGALRDGAEVVVY